MWTRSVPSPLPLTSLSFVRVRVEAWEFLLVPAVALGDEFLVALAGGEDHALPVVAQKAFGGALGRHLDRHREAGSV